MLLKNAITKGEINSVQEIILVTPSCVTEKDEHGYSPLHLAFCCGECEIIKFLVESGADVNAINEDGANLLHLIQDKCEPTVEILEFLFKSGVDIELHDKNGDTPLHNAVSRGFLPTVSFYIKNGASIDSLNNRGETPLFRACDEGVMESKCADFLLRAGADWNIKNIDGDTSLMRLKNGKVKVVFINGELYPMEFPERYYRGMIKKLNSWSKANPDGACSIQQRTSKLVKKTETISV